METLKNLMDYLRLPLLAIDLSGTVRVLVEQHKER